MGKSGATVSFWDRPSGAADRRVDPPRRVNSVGPVPLARCEKEKAQECSFLLHTPRLRKEI